MKNIIILFIISLLSITIKAQTLNEVRLEEYRKLTESRVADLQNYISIITNKSLSMEERREAIEQATDLFLEGSKMQVTGKNNTTKRVSIGGYFNSLLSLPQYEKVVITNYDVATVSKFEKGVDGNYHAVATYFQKFEGFKNGVAIYADKTRKDVSVLGEIVNKDKSDNDMKIFFGDVTVRETKYSDKQ
jgi:catechol-2,3-dioxygenase